LRVWAGLTDETMRPTKKGITLRLETFPEFRSAIGRLEAAIAARQPNPDEPSEGGE